jgi:cytidine deaminase
VALLTKAGNIYSGSYVESVAYNPGLPPLQSALVAFVARDGGSYGDLDHAVLVEKKGAPVQFFETSELLLKKIAPRCRFHVLHANGPAKP